MKKKLIPVITILPLEACNQNTKRGHNTGRFQERVRISTNHRPGIRYKSSFTQDPIDDHLNSPDDSINYI